MTLPQSACPQTDLARTATQPSAWNAALLPTARVAIAAARPDPGALPRSLPTHRLGRPRCLALRACLPRAPAPGARLPGLASPLPARPGAGASPHWDSVLTDHPATRSGGDRASGRGARQLHPQGQRSALASAAPGSWTAQIRGGRLCRGGGVSFRRLHCTPCPPGPGVSELPTATPHRSCIFGEARGSRGESPDLRAAQAKAPGPPGRDEKLGNPAVLPNSNVSCKPAAQSASLITSILHQKTGVMASFTSL